MLNSALVVGCVGVMMALPAWAAIEIDANFENGHIGQHEWTAPNALKIGPVLGHRELWQSFKLKGVKGQRVDFTVEWINRGSMYLPNFNGRINDGMVVSYGGEGHEIIYTKFAPKDPTAIEGQNFKGNFLQTFSHVFREDEALVSYGAPYSNTRVAALVERLKGDARVKVDSVGLTQLEKRPIPYLRVTDPAVEDAGKKRVMLTAREDSYETGGSWAAEGALNFLLSSDPVAEEMRRRSVFYIVPIFSVDGVAMAHTNYPMNKEGSEYIYVTAQWAREPAFEEVKAMKDFWTAMKARGEQIDVSMRLHASCYWENHFRAEHCAEERKEDSQKLLGILRRNMPWRTAASFNPAQRTSLSSAVQDVFPQAITYSSHNDFIFTKRDLGSEKPVIRRHEDVLQDGELIVRSMAEMFGMPTEKMAPFVMAGNTSTNHGKAGDEVTFSCYYFDPRNQPAKRVAVVIGGQAYEMKGPEKPDWKRPTRFEYTMKLQAPRNDYHFVVANEEAERRIPVDYELPGPFLLDEAR